MMAAHSDKSGKKMFFSVSWSPIYGSIEERDLMEQKVEETRRGEREGMALEICCTEVMHWRFSLAGRAQG